MQYSKIVCVICKKFKIIYWHMPVKHSLYDFTLKRYSALEEQTSVRIDISYLIYICMYKMYKIHKQHSFMQHTPSPKLHTSKKWIRYKIGNINTKWMLCFIWTEFHYMQAKDIQQTKVSIYTQFLRRKAKYTIKFGMHCCECDVIVLNFILNVYVGMIRLPNVYVYEFPSHYFIRSLKLHTSNKTCSISIA